MKNTNLPNYQSIMIVIVFEKAFNFLNLNFLVKSLESFGFGTSLGAWIKTFYKNITSCVMVFILPLSLLNGGGGGGGAPG